MKKKIIILSAVVFGLALAGFFAYRAGYLADYFGNPNKFSPTKFLVFKSNNSNLTPESIQAYEEKFNRAKARLEKDQADYNSWMILALIKKGVSDYQGAYDIWTFVVANQPQNATAFVSLGDLCANFLNQPGKAEIAFHKALEISPGNIEAYLGLADLYRYKMPGKENLYEQTLLDALKALPDNGNIIGPLAMYYRQTNQIDKAIEYYEKLVKIAPNNETAKQDLAELKKLKQ